jgi:phage terminase small subunit
MRKLKPKDKEFADCFLETNNASLAVRKAFPESKPSIAGVKGHRLLKKVNVQDYIESKAEMASNRVAELAKQSKNLLVALNASKDILDRAGYKPIEKHESTKNVVFSLSGLFQRTKAFKQINAPEENNDIKEAIIIPQKERKRVEKVLKS